MLHHLFMQRQKHRRDVTKTGNGEWGMGNGEWGMGNGEWGMGNGEWGIENGKFIIFFLLKRGMGNGKLRGEIENGKSNMFLLKREMGNRNFKLVN